MHVFVCVFLTIHQWSSKRQHDWMTSSFNDAIESINQDSVSDLSYAESIVHQYDLIARLYNHWSSFLSERQKFARSTSLYTSYLSARHSSIFARASLLLQLEKDSEIHVFARQIDASSSFLFRKVLNFSILSISNQSLHRIRLLLSSQQHRTKEMIKAMKFRFNRERNKISSISSTIFTTNSSTSSKSTTKFSISRFVTFSERTRNSSTLVNESWYWYKEQNEIVKNLSEWLEVLITAKSLSKLSIQTSSSTSSISAATSKQIISSKRSSLFLFTLKIVSKRVKIASTTCSLISFATSSSRLRKSQKLHLTIDDLIRMFVEKSKSVDLSQHQNHRSFSRSFDVRQSWSSSTYQSRIIAYFLSAVNQKTSITQSLKSSKSKSFQQRTSAKSISRCRSALSEKSIFSSYKMTDIFYINRRSWQSKFSTSFSSRFSFRSSLTSSSFFRVSSSNHVCCICFDRFNFRNDLFDYSRFNQRYSSNRRSIEEMK